MMRRSESISGPTTPLPLRVRNDGSNHKKGKLTTTGSRTSTGPWSSANRCGVGTSAGSLRKSSIQRYSLAGIQKERLSRGSGMGMRGRSDVPKDPRPISDKGHTNRNVKKLVEFMTEQGFKVNLPNKMLHSPTSKDFIKLFEFVYGHLCPDYRVGSKLEEEFPRILKLLGYPFNITKSYMFSIGSPHTWPHILAALIWIVELIKRGLATLPHVDITMFAANDDEFDCVPEKKLMFDYVEKTYFAYMGGQDVYEMYDDSLAQKLKEKYVGGVKGIDSIFAENNRLEEEIAMLEQELDLFPKLSEQKASAELDGTKFQIYLGELDNFQKGCEKQYIIVEEQLTTLAAEHNCLLEKKNCMQVAYDNQEFTAADVEIIRMNHKELERQMNEINQQIVDVDQDMWKEEVELTKSREKLENRCNEYNKVGRKMKLIPVNSENAHGIDYELKPSYNSYMNTDFMTTIKPALTQLNKQCSESLNKKGTEKIKVENALEQVTDMAVDGQEEIHLLGSKVKRAEEEVDCKKQSFQSECQRRQMAIESIEKDVFVFRRNLSATVEEALQQQRQEEKSFDKRSKEMARQEQEKVDFLYKIVGEVVAHKEAIENKLQEKVKESEHLLEKTKMETDQVVSESKQLMEKMQKLHEKHCNL